MQVANLRSFFGYDAVPGFQGRASNGRHLPEIVGLRGVAIIIVVFGHMMERIQRFYMIDGVLADGHPLPSFWDIFFNVFATPFSGCYLFFVISGYLLIRNFGPRPAYLRRANTVRYVRTRLLRVYIPYAIVLCITLIFLEVTNYTPEGTRQFFTEPKSLMLSWLASLALSHEFLFGTFPRLFPPGWFIETQCQFYIIGPILWFPYSKITSSTPRLCVGTLILGVLSALSLNVIDSGSANIHYSLIAFLPYFWTGVLVDDVRRCRCTVAVRYFPLGWLSLGLLIFLGFPGHTTVTYLLMRIGCLIALFCAAFELGSSFRKVIVSRWLSRIGIASYSIYLVHLQVLQIVVPNTLSLVDQAPPITIVLACSMCGLLAVMAVSVGFYWLVERPCVVSARLSL